MAAKDPLRLHRAFEAEIGEGCLHHRRQQRHQRVGPGALAGIAMNGNPVVDFNDLQKKVVSLVGAGRGPDSLADKTEVEMDCDYGLNYADVVRAITAVSGTVQDGQVVELIKKIVPNAKRVGMVYNPGEANSVVVVKKLQEILPKSGMSLVEAAAPRSVDVASAARSLIGKVDVIYTNTDNNVVSAYESLVKVGNDAKIPLIASDTDSVKRGGIAALGINYRDLGVQTGKVVVPIKVDRRYLNLPVRLGDGKPQRRTVRGPDSEAQVPSESDRPVLHE
jgi:hypothetical protein